MVNMAIYRSLPNDKSKKWKFSPLAIDLLSLCIYTPGPKFLPTDPKFFGVIRAIDRDLPNEAVPCFRGEAIQGDQSGFRDLPNEAVPCFRGGLSRVIRVVSRSSKRA